MKTVFRKWGSAVLGLISGALNGLFGAGGGITVVPMLEQLEVSPQKAHATSVAIILPLSIASAAVYLFRGVPLHSRELLWLIPTGLIGAVVGTRLLKKIPAALLRRIFGIIMIYSGMRLILS